MTGTVKSEKKSQLSIFIQLTSLESKKEKLILRKIFNEERKRLTKWTPCGSFDTSKMKVLNERLVWHVETQVNGIVGFEVDRWEHCIHQTREVESGGLNRTGLRTSLTGFVMNWNGKR